MTSQFLWVIYPYFVLTIFVFGHILRFHNHQLEWTAKSSEIFEKRALKWGSQLFHWGIIAVFFGHVAGLLIPISVYHALGVPDELYHKGALYGGGVAGIAAAVGVLILLGRRVNVRRVWKNTSVSDLVAILLLTIVILTGMTATSLNASVGFDYRTTINPWVRGVLAFHPDRTLMDQVPLPFKIHMFAALSLFAVWPFTRLVHVISLPITYLWRTYVLYRKRTPQKKRQHSEKPF